MKKIRTKEGQSFYCIKIKKAERFVKKSSSFFKLFLKPQKEKRAVGKQMEDHPEDSISKKKKRFWKNSGIPTKKKQGGSYNGEDRILYQTHKRNAKEKFYGNTRQMCGPKPAVGSQRGAGPSWGQKCAASGGNGH